MEERIKIVDNGICVDIEQLKKIITDKWHDLNKYYYKQGYRGDDLYRTILGEIADYADGLAYRSTKTIRKT